MSDYVKNELTIFNKLQLHLCFPFVPQAPPAVGQVGAPVAAWSRASSTSTESGSGRATGSGSGKASGSAMASASARALGLAMGAGLQRDVGARARRERREKATEARIVNWIVLDR